ncbi:hypothetical protein Rsub_08054 [Raphidocelis subcapitata]|uniref:J domain-containing protein n=1 Tax=Raphidocelis subcapitata TaxID=307507 RepID=A0A2V0P7U3_9CHLO|nr:hypothetical protein Rsub_08054 [Raphidocelis subcapitata]|eukprot:GBF95931.1 hypothetical protein Rsub_08054 [Raphidocelis subcapitata]
MLLTLAAAAAAWEHRAAAAAAPPLLSAASAAWRSCRHGHAAAAARGQQPRPPAALLLAAGWAPGQPPRRAASSSAAPSGRGGLPPGPGPERAALAALPFCVARPQADAAFKAFHSRHWLQNAAVPRWARAGKESFLPFWVGEAQVEVEVLSAEVGRDEVVSARDPRTGRRAARYETVWRRVELAGRLGWRARHAPEEPGMQLYAAYKYPRADIDALRPGPLIGSARPITPDMLQAGPGAPSDTRRVGAFTLPPEVARRLLKSRIESAERRRAEAAVSEATGFPHVRFVQLAVTWLGPAADEGPRLSPVYVPFYVFSWMHAGIKVRTFVSGADGRASGAHHLDPSKVAVLATAATGGALLLSGAAGAMTAGQLFAAGVAVPFVASTLLARFWPALRHVWHAGTERLRAAWHMRGRREEETDWSADFVGAYSRSGGPRAGGGADRGSGPADWSEFVRDPWAWLEREMKRQQERAERQQRQWQSQQQQWGGGGGGGAGGASQRQQQRQRRPGGGGGGGGGFAGGGRPPPGASPRDALGYYARLGVPPDVSQQELGAAFRGLAMRHHPDRAGGEAEKAAATKRFQELSEAYRVLRDPSSRARYDATGSA